MNKLQLTTDGEKMVVVRRRFDATPEEVYRAHVEPELLQQWLLGPEGWTMPVCINEGRPGGKIRYEWLRESSPAASPESCSSSDAHGGSFYLTGELIELSPPHRIVHVERMHLPDPTPDNHVVTTFEADGDGTLMTMRMTLPSEAVRRAMLATGMERGMEDSYVRLEALCKSGHGR